MRRSDPKRTSIPLAAVLAQQEVEVHVDHFLRIAGAEPAVEQHLDVRRQGGDRVLSPVEGNDQLALQAVVDHVLQRVDRVSVAIHREIAQSIGEGQTLEDDPCQDPSRPHRPAATGGRTTGSFPRSGRRRPNAEAKWGGSQKPAIKASSEMCRRCMQACQETNANTTICGQSRSRRVPAQLPTPTASNATNGQKTGLSGVGGAHSVISGRGLPSERTSQPCNSQP